MNSSRAAFGVTPQGAMRVARRSRFHRILGENSSRRTRFAAGPPQGETAPSGDNDPRNGGVWGLVP
jgi:hypothetical protein